MKVASNPEALSLEKFFEQFRKKIIGIDQEFISPYGRKKLIYADWTASGRLYRGIEEKLINEFGPFVANTHTETTVSGTAMTLAYHQARNLIKKHVNAGEDDVFIAAGTGMTGVVNKFQRILGLKVPESLRNYMSLPLEKRPVVFVSHMEHHSNQTSWLETIAHVEVIGANDEGLICLESFGKLLEKYRDHPLKIASVTACSNVTGIQTPYYDIARMIHEYNGLCFVDFACSAPYVPINMHPDGKSYLDAIFFSPHKFLGGPATSGILIFNKHLYKNKAPDHPGGGTVSWTNPWGEHAYIEDIEVREDGGTPGFIQVIKSALAIQLKEEMGSDNMIRREHEILEQLFTALKKIPNLYMLAGQHENRLGVVSFYIENLHFNLGVKLLNDRFGIQSRGGCSCAGTYGHFLFHIDRLTSQKLYEKVSQGELSKKPGWIRISIHPTTSDEEVGQICRAITALAKNHPQWSADYTYNPSTNEFTHKTNPSFEKHLVAQWFADSKAG